MFHVIEKFGVSMSLMKYDIGGHMFRLDAKYELDPSTSCLLYGILCKDIEHKTTKGSYSFTNTLPCLVINLVIYLVINCDN